MYSAEFIFEPGEHTDEFEQLNTLMNEAARNTTGFIAAETHYSDGTRLINVTYYWENMLALQAFSKHPGYIKARHQQAANDGHALLVSEEIRSYGNDALGQIAISKAH